jgi:hypothetical protein
VASLTRTAFRLAGMPVAGTRALLRAGVELERDVRAASVHALERAVLAVADELMSRPVAGELVEHTLVRLESTELAQRVAARMLEDGIAEEIAERALASPEAERILVAALRSGLFDDAVAELLKTDGLWLLVDEVARSPSVLEAVAHQGTGFAEQVGERARSRSRRADAWVERVAGRTRRHDAEHGPPDASAPTVPATRPPGEGS